MPKASLSVNTCAFVRPPEREGINHGGRNPNSTGRLARCPGAGRFAFRCGGWAWLVAVLLAFDGLGVAPVLGQNTNRPGSARQQNPATRWAEFVEPDFPFISSVLEARKLGEGWPSNNLTPRGLVLNLGHGAWACFDTDFLRVSAIWMGNAVTPESMPQMSYHNARSRPPWGQERLPLIRGTPWLANGLYPGWQTGETFSLQDPREPAPDPTELGLGPIDPARGEFKAVRFVPGGVTLEYDVAGVRVVERMNARMINGQPIIQREFRLQSVPKTFWLLLGSRPETADEKLQFSLSTDGTGGRSRAELLREPNGMMAVRVGVSAQPVTFRVAMGFAAEIQTWTNTVTSETRQRDAISKAAPRWPQNAVSRAELATNTAAYVVDNIEMPLNNPWKRNIRPVDLAFFKDGRAAVVTFEGDVFIVSGLNGNLEQITWKRFTSGLHEPMGIALRDEQIFVFDRHGIWHLRDTDGNGEADAHELFCNRFTQTAETREYASAIRLAPDRSFVIAKGGIQMSTIGRQNGTVLRVSPDGKKVTTLGWGLREPFIAVHPRTGMVTASDQEGNYVPTTPLHVVEGNKFYGFLPEKHPPEKYPAPITEPLVWIPRQVNASAMSQVWLVGAKMGPLNDALIHIGYYRPELFAVLLNKRTPRLQAAVVSVTQDLAFAPLNGAVSPADGQLYVGGFQIWGTRARQINGLGRLRYTGAPSTLPVEITPMNEGILLRFDVALDAPRSVNPANFVVEYWNYKRTPNYGSPHFKLDGSRGQETLTPSSAYVSRDRKSVFVGVPGMKAGVHQMRIGWSLVTDKGLQFEHTAYLTPYELASLKPEAEGFGRMKVDLTPRLALAAATPVTVEEGKRLAELYACISCHSSDGSMVGKLGPTWRGLFGKERELVDGTKVIADDEYLRKSIIDPAAQIPKDSDRPDAQMPTYEGILNKEQIEALILYIKSLEGGGVVEAEPAGQEQPQTPSEFE